MRVLLTEQERNNYVKDSIRLFKLVPDFAIKTQNVDDIPWFNLLTYGCLIVNKDGSIVTYVPRKIYNEICDTYGAGVIEFNQTFYQSFKEAANKSLEERIGDQLTHYFSTYGLESLGLKASPYFPENKFRDALGDMANTVTIKVDKIVVFRVTDDDEITDKARAYFTDLKTPNTVVKTSFENVWWHFMSDDSQIASFELKVIYYKKTGRVPKGNIDFLRYAVYVTTGSPMLIKNETSVRAIKCGLYGSRNSEIVDLWKSCNINKMAEIFYRYKPLFLAFKRDIYNRKTPIAPIINKIRRAAVENHKPLTDVSVQNVINLYLQDRLTEMNSILNKCDNRDLVKLINSVSCTLYTDKIKDGIKRRVFNIRNGKTFVKNESIEKTSRTTVSKLFMFEIFLYSILSSRLKEKYKDVIFYIPEYIDYAMPTSEKQMVGFIPWGSFINIPTENNDFTIGVHWKNTKERVDLDLHLIGMNGEHYGWNSYWKDNGSSIIYSGDVTDAPLPNGASEAFLVKNFDKPLVANLNLFSGSNKVPYQLFFASDKIEDFDQKYVFNPKNQIISPIPMEIYNDSRSSTIGILKDKTFTFYGGRVGDGVVPRTNLDDFIIGLDTKLESMLRTKEFLSDVAYEVTSDKSYLTDSHINADTGEEFIVINLSPEALDATTMQKLVLGTIADEEREKRAAEKAEIEKKILSHVTE